MPFSLTREPIPCGELSAALANSAAGGLSTFEGRVRDNHLGREVLSLTYEAYDKLAESEGDRILAEASKRFSLCGVRTIHRIGELAIGDAAIWIGALAAHRQEAFAACRWVIDEVKAHVPIWKKEFYADGPAEWVNCACGHQQYAHDAWQVHAAHLGLTQLAAYTLIDIREPMERLGDPAWVHAVPNLPLSEPDIYLQLPADRPFLLACAKGIRSRNLTLWLREQGHENFFSLDTGIHGLAHALA